MWSSIYANADERQEITLSALTPMFQNDEFTGVIVTDIKINTFNAFLNQLQTNTNAAVYIFDQAERLVAHPSKSSVVSWGTRDSKKGERLLAVESGNPIIQASAKYVKTHQIYQTQAITKFESDINGERYFNFVTPYKDPHGLTWYIGVSISESDLLGNLPEAQRNSWLLGVIVSVVGLTIGLVAFNRITTPITSTAAAAKHLALGNWDNPMPKPGHIHETSMLVYAFNEMANNLKASFKALRTQLVYDSLTGLYSREGLIESCESRSKLTGCLYLIGINKFRDINDSVGHYRADKLLVIISERIKALFDDQAMIARIAGDEFAIYLTDDQDAEAISLNTSRILQSFSSPFSMGADNIAVSISVGIVTDIEENNMTVWLRNGSIALSNAKRDHTHISHYSPEMADVTLKRTQLQSKIRQAIDLNEFVPFYQPIVELKTGRIVGAEALARWISPIDGLISPLDFIPIAEESGLIGDIGKAILQQACQDTAQGISEGKWGEDFNLHVNLSVNQLSQPDFIPTLKQILKETKIEPSRLTLEITESRIVDNDPVIVHNMQSIRDLGVYIAIDDFGTGYSSLAYLHKLPFNCLKIDRTFVNKLEADTLDTSIVAAIINMTQSMNVSLVAEGVETTSQSDMLIQLGCPLGQGFLYSRPVPYEEWPTDLVNMN